MSIKRSDSNQKSIKNASNIPLLTIEFQENISDEHEGITLSASMDRQVPQYGKYEHLSVKISTPERRSENEQSQTDSYVQTQFNYDCDISNVSKIDEMENLDSCLDSSVCSPISIDVHMDDGLENEVHTFQPKQILEEIQDVHQSQILEPDISIPHKENSSVSHLHGITSHSDLSNKVSPILITNESNLFNPVERASPDNSIIISTSFEEPGLMPQNPHSQSSADYIIIHEDDF